MPREVPVARYEDWLPPDHAIAANPWIVPPALVKAMTAVRESYATPEDGRPTCYIGGNFVLSEIRQNHIARRVVHRWDDIVGQSLN